MLHFVQAYLILESEAKQKDRQESTYSNTKDDGLSTEKGMCIV